PGDPVLISEADEPNITELTKLYGLRNDEVQLPMDFQVADINRLSAKVFRKLFDEIENNAASGQPYIFFSNHDQPRQWDRYGDGIHNDAIARVMAALLLTTKVTPQMYYGEEIGMRTTPPARKEDVRDPIGKLGWPREKGRDGERTPMQWKNEPNAGFSKNAPWLPVPASYATHNVETELKDPGSILNFYKRILALRHTHPALLEGAYVPLNQDDLNVLSYLRTYKGKAVLVALNMSNAVQKVTFDLSQQGFATAKLKPLAASQAEAVDSGVSLQPFGAFVGEVVK